MFNIKKEMFQSVREFKFPRYFNSRIFAIINTRDFFFKSKKKLRLSQYFFPAIFSSFKVFHS